MWCLDSNISRNPSPWPLNIGGVLGARTNGTPADGEDISEPTRHLEPAKTFKNPKSLLILEKYLHPLLDFHPLLDLHPI